MTEISTIISTIGFPITACIGLAWFCKYMIDQNNVHVDRMFDLYAKANEENRHAIEANTSILQKLVEKLDQED